MRKRNNFLCWVCDLLGRRGEGGQSATEYMLVIAVIVLGLISAASHFIPAFNQAVAVLAQNVSGWLTTDQQMSNAQ